MSTFIALVRRESRRVALSLRVQPLWFRVLKWSRLVPFMYWLWQTRWFWPVILALAAACLALHLFHRWKTAGWTGPWGEWNDLGFADGAVGPA